MHFWLFWFGFDRKGAGKQAGKPLMPAFPSKAFPPEGRVGRDRVAAFMRSQSPGSAGGSLTGSPAKGLKSSPHSTSPAMQPGRAPSACRKGWLFSNLHRGLA